MKKYAMIILMTIFLMAIHAEEKTKSTERSGFGGFTIGVQSMDLGKLNNIFEDHGFDKFDNVFTTFGGGGYGTIGRNFLIGGSGGGFMEARAENDSTIAVLSGGEGFFELGYIVYETKNFSMVPMFGFGGTGLDITLKPKNLSSDSFGELLDNPAKSCNLTTGNSAIKLGLMNMFQFDAGGNDDESLTIGAALHFGAIYNMGDSMWDFDDIDVSGGPDLSKWRYFLNFSVYFGGSKR
ncbi:MAG: hypothetical protein JXR48_15065 [Candidatus Delongbacteria bacterium]|nr:hypothetical protein [Candidatus Delongbacteria bacterium]MBN2836277.1 hypothetical protein [Candidatus Delongbacteria bacterium]